MIKLQKMFRKTLRPRIFRPCLSNRARNPCAKGEFRAWRFILVRFSFRRRFSVRPAFRLARAYVRWPARAENPSDFSTKNPSDFREHIVRTKNVISLRIQRSGRVRENLSVFAKQNSFASEILYSVSSSGAKAPPGLKPA